MIKMTQFPIFYLLLSGVVGQSLSNVVNYSQQEKGSGKGRKRRKKNKNLINNQLVWTECGKKNELSRFLIKTELTGRRRDVNAPQGSRAQFWTHSHMYSMTLNRTSGLTQSTHTTDIPSNNNYSIAHHWLLSFISHTVDQARRFSNSQASFSWDAN